MPEAPEASLSCLFYLFADQVVPTVGRWRPPWGGVAVPVPGRDELVFLGPLERLLLAVALWDLAATGLIALTPDPARHQGRFRVTAGPGFGDVPGLGGRLLAGVATGGTSLWELVLDCWYTTGHPMALNAVIVEAQVEAMNLGVIERPKTPRPVAGRPGRTTFPKVYVHRSRLEAQRQPFLTVAGRWTHAAQVGGVASELLNGCREALSYARPVVEDSGSSA